MNQANECFTPGLWKEEIGQTVRDDQGIDALRI